jgi:hypothetical protein
MKDLNELLKIKAERQLQKEINAFILSIRDNRFFSSIETLNVCVNDEEKETLRTFLWNGNRKAGKMILEDYLPEYIEKEAKDFMDKVDMFEQDIDELRNQQ